MHRIDLGLRVQFFTGHGWLRRHCHVIDKITDPICGACYEAGSLETPEHLWTSCKGTEFNRQCHRITGLNEDSKTLSWSMKKVNRFLETTLMVNLLVRTQQEQSCMSD